MPVTRRQRASFDQDDVEPPPTQRSRSQSESSLRRSPRKLSESSMTTTTSSRKRSDSSSSKTTTSQTREPSKLLDAQQVAEHSDALTSQETPKRDDNGGKKRRKQKHHSETPQLEKRDDSAGKKKKKKKKHSDTPQHHLEKQPDTETPGKEDVAMENNSSSPNPAELPIKRPPMVDSTVHRLRNFRFVPQPIVCMAKHGDRHLVVSRQSQVELVECYKFRTIARILVRRSLSCLVWCRDTCIASSSDRLCIVDFGGSALIGSTSSGGGAVYCLEPYHQHPDDYILAGCQDGSVRMYDRSLTLVRTLPTAGAPILSVTVYQGSVFAGVADGTIRRYDNVPNNKSIWKCTVRMTVECRGRTAPTKVWCLDTLGDTIVSGDSLGNVQFWHPQGVFLKSIEQNDHQADVLCINTTEDRVFASGVDSRIVCIEKLQDFCITHAQRPHTHDVHAMCIVDSQLITGGVDTKLCYFDTLHFGRRRPQVLYPWPTETPVSRSDRHLVMRRRDEVEIYEVASPNQDVSRGPVVIDDQKKRTIKVNKGLVTSCALSDKYLALSDAYLLKLFSIQQADPVPLSTPTGIGAIASVSFLTSNLLVVACIDNCVHIVDIQEDGRVSLLQSLSTNNVLNDDDKLLPVHRIFQSKNGQWFGTLQNGYKQNRVDIFRKTDGEQFEFWWSLPDVKATAATFLATERVRVAVACVDFEMYLFDVEKRQLDNWSESAGVPLKLPLEVKSRKDFPISITSNPALPHVILLGSFGAILALDTLQSRPKRCRFVPERHVRGKKRNTLGESSGGTSCTMCLRYNGMLFMDFADANEMIVVEEPWLNVVSTLPDALQRKVYGA